jgi:hypothetical protein
MLVQSTGEQRAAYSETILSKLRGMTSVVRLIGTCLRVSLARFAYSPDSDMINGAFCAHLLRWICMVTL